MKKTILLLLSLVSTGFSATLVGPSGGSFTILAEDFDSVINGTVDIALNTAAAGDGTPFADYTLGGATAQYNLTGLDFANFTYTISIDAEARTGQNQVIQRTVTITPGDFSSTTLMGVVVPDTNFNAATDFGLVSASNNGVAPVFNQALTDSFFQIDTGGAIHFNNIFVDITATPIPEPTSVALLGLGGLVVLGRRRRS